MNALFLADAHLRGPESPMQAKILRLLEGLQGPEGTLPAPLPLGILVIAGDFFDFWFSRGEKTYPGFLPVIERLADLKNAGVRIVLCEGNHDFHLNDYFALRRGFEVYPEAVELRLDGRRVWVAHGDTVDRENRRYLALRRFLRSALARRLQNTLPLPFLWGLARFSAELSKGISPPGKDRLTAVMYRYARARLQEGYDAVVLGHCHEPCLRQEEGKTGVKTFATLGDWRIHDSYLLCREGRFSLHRL